MVTLVSCFYQLKNKHKNNEFVNWIGKFACIQKCTILVYTDKRTYPLLQPILQGNLRITIVLRELEEFSTYSLKDKWQYNHSINPELNKLIEWKVNMLYAEKIAFVQDAQKRCPEEEWFIWCDIGYFRRTITREQLYQWPNLDKIQQLDSQKIYYNFVQGYSTYNESVRRIQNKNVHGLPSPPIQANQLSFAGGFFMIHRSKVSWWNDTYYAKLHLYFQHKYVVKDDQMLILNCIVEHPSDFHIVRSANKHDWLFFQQYLL